MDLELKGKVAMITGAGEGIGRRTALTLAREGCSIVVLDIVPARADAVAEEVKAAGAKALPLVTDVTDAAKVEEAVRTVLTEFGHIDILVNNAYAADNRQFTQSGRTDWDRPINVCLYGTLNCSRAVINHMIERKHGKIVSMVSEAYRDGDPTRPIYAAAKAAVLAFTRSLAKEVGKHGINVNCVCPGATNTERRIRQHQAEWEKATEEERERIKKRDERQLKLYPLGRLGKPEDMADAIAFLCSERAGYITGQVLSVNGGYMMA